MKKMTTPTLLCLLLAATARADTTLAIPALYSCLTDFGAPVGIPNPPTVAGTFNLNGVSGQGVMQSQVPGYWDEHVPPANTEQKLYTYSYTVDLSGLSPAANHCVKLLIHFGEPAGCAGPGVQGDPGQIQSATLNPWGDITFVFNGGCLNPGQSAISFSMVGEAGFKTNFVTIMDEYVDQASGQTNQVKINVPAIVPDVPPDPPPWVLAYYYSRLNPPRVSFQGDLDLVGTNQTSTNLPPIHADGNYDFTLQLLTEETNGLPVGNPVTVSNVLVRQGLFQIPLPGEPVEMGDGSVRYLGIGVRPSYTGGTFQALVPAVQIAPTPQAFYAYTAGSVADLTPGQAVTSLNGLTDGVNLVAGSGISIGGAGGNSLIISALPGGPSDRNLKTDFAAVDPENILSKLAALPIESWRYTNELAGIRHVGPMAQDFKAVFKLGNSDKMIGYLDASGVALAAIQGLDRKLDEHNQALEAQLEKKDAEIEQLQQSIAELEKAVGKLTKQKGDEQ